MVQDSSRPAFWESRYREHITPWDAGDTPERLRMYAPMLKTRARILSPGCGSAYEAAYLAQLGFDVLAIDFSPAALAAAQTILGERRDIARLADFFVFEFDDRFDVIYERAFLCALPRNSWKDYARRCAQLLKPGGVIAGFFFFDDTPRGPPFGTSAAELELLLGADFRLIEDDPVADSIPVFAGKERWMVWEKKSSAYDPLNLQSRGNSRLAGSCR
jgi:SAM-dependent methyltransferase